AGEGAGAHHRGAPPVPGGARRGHHDDRFPRAAARSHDGPGHRPASRAAARPRARVLPLRGRWRGEARWERLAPRSRRRPARDATQPSDEHQRAACAGRHEQGGRRLADREVRPAGASGRRRAPQAPWHGDSRRRRRLHAPPRVEEAVATRLDPVTIELRMRPARRFRLRGNWRTLLVVLGPGLVSGFADNDAGGIATYSIAGAQFGYGLMWSLFVTMLALSVTQEAGARLGLATGQGLAGLIRERFGVRGTAFAVAVMLAANLGTIVAEFAGIAAALSLFGVP